MKYHDGTTVSLGDVVSVPIPSGRAEARVVMLGDSYEHLAIDSEFLAWVQRDKVLSPSSVVIERLGDNPFAHDNPAYAPVGNYMFSAIDEDVVLLPNKRLQPIARETRSG